MVEFLASLAVTVVTNSFAIATRLVEDAAPVLTNSESRVIQSERSMIEHAQELFVLADGSKFGARGHLTLLVVIV